MIYIISSRHPDLHQDEIEAIQEMFSYAEKQGWLK